MSNSSTAFRPLRSVLYMPGSNAKALQKARSLPADALILDLEDAVSPDAKEQARKQVLEALAEGGYEKRDVVVRINALASRWGRDDLQAIARTRLDAVLIPKVETPADVLQVISLLDEAGAGDDLPVWAMIETPLGVLNIQQIAAAHQRLRVLVMGTNDLSKELRIPQTADRAGFITAFGLCLMAARAYGLEIIDGVYIHLNDDLGLRAACEQGKALGFDGKTLIHPKQLATANSVFSPDEKELAQAQAIIDAWKEAQALGQGVVVVDGRLVEALHVQEAQRLLQIASSIEALVKAG